MRYIVLIAVVLMLIPCAAYAGHRGCCKKPCCESGGCHPSCDKCHDRCGGNCGPTCGCPDKCHSGCSGKCHSGCGSKCGATCGGNCGPTCGCPDKCHRGCGAPCAGACGAPCDTGCKPACACQAWMDYCGCGEVNSLCITIDACEGTAGPLKLQLRDQNNKTVTIIELPGPVDCFYSYTYTFDKPIDAAQLDEAVLINDTDDPATLTSLRVAGLGGCFCWTYVDHSCPGTVIGPGGCKRMVIY